MKIIENPLHLQGQFQRPVLTIGIFDGVHGGHRRLLERLKREAAACSGEAVVLTFDPHPLQFLAPDRCPPMIQTRRQKLEILESLGLDGVIIYPFTAAFAALEAEDFVRRILVGELSAAAIIIGQHFVFGLERKGNVALLQRMSQPLGFRVIPIDESLISGEMISSTLIRKKITGGDLQSASQLLGRPYCIDGSVVGGMKLGTRLGFPTANIESDNFLLLPNGVFGASADIQAEKWTGIASLGVRPTIQSADNGRPRERVLEVHLFDFHGNLYGSRIRVHFHFMVRGERQFPSIQRLAKQIERDIRECRQYFQNHGP